MYQLTHDPDVIRCVETGAFIPRGHYLWPTEWLGAGNIPLPAEPTLSAEELRTQLKDRATARRWAVETGGISVGGTPIMTGTADQNRITTVLAAINLGLESVDFKAGSGWVRMTAEQIRAIASVVSHHTQLCFSAEREHHEAIDACPDELLVTYDVDDHWPSGVY